ncbi:hypothetical protein CBL_12649 [Carabus blaptoides fortunei]
MCQIGLGFGEGLHRYGPGEADVGRYRRHFPRVRSHGPLRHSNVQSFRSEIGLLTKRTTQCEPVALSLFHQAGVKSPETSIGNGQSTIRDYRAHNERATTT